MASQQHVLTASEPDRRHGEPDRRHGWLLVAALVLTGLSMRTAVTSVGAVLDDLQAGLHMSSGVSGVVTTLPVICFALIGAATPRLAHRFGAHLLLVLSLVAMTAGLLARAAVGSIWAFVLLSVLALSGGAIANVLMPTLVKRHFPDRIGRMTAVYTTALAVGTTAAAGLTVPFGSLGGGGSAAGAPGSARGRCSARSRCCPGCRHCGTTGPNRVRSAACRRTPCCAARRPGR